MKLFSRMLAILIKAFLLLLLLAKTCEMRNEYESLIGQLFRQVLKDPEFYSLPIKEQIRVLKTLSSLHGRYSSQIPLRF
jgi:hypothetical protein